MKIKYSYRECERTNRAILEIDEEHIYMYDIERGGIFLPYKEENIGIEWD